MARLSSFSQANAPIVEGKQTVRFAPDMIAYYKEHGCFPEYRDGRGDYLHIQFVLSNGARTASWKEDRMERNPKYLDNIKLYFDGKFEGDGFQMKLTYRELQKRERRYANMTFEDILLDLMKKGTFDVWFYRYNSNGKGYLQVAWNKEMFDSRTSKKSKKAVTKVEVAEEALPMELN